MNHDMYHYDSVRLLGGGLPEREKLPSAYPVKILAKKS